MVYRKTLLPLPFLSIILAFHQWSFNILLHKLPSAFQMKWLWWADNKAIFPLRIDVMQGGYMQGLEYI